MVPHFINPIMLYKYIRNVNSNPSNQILIECM